MKTTPEHDERMANMTFASVYLHYVTEVEKKGRTKEEVRFINQQFETKSHYLRSHDLRHRRNGTFRCAIAVRPRTAG